MTTPLIEKLNITSSVSIVIISISLMLFGGFAMTRITKRLKLPNVTAYIVAGILMGPYCLNLIPVGLIERMDFIADIALAFIAFSTGEFFRFSTLKKSGVKVLLITFLEACLASIAVFIATHYVLGLDMVFSVVLAALASATAPASTMMTIRQTHAKGDFVDTLLQVVALDDVVGLVAYSIAISIALASMTGNFQAQNVLRPIIMNLFAFALGGVFGLILKFLLHKRSTDNRLIVSIALLFAFCGICALMGVSSLLGCMSMSMIYINTSDDERLFKQLNYFSPPLLLLFFVRSGLNFDLGAIFSSSDHIGSASLLAVGVVYFVTRILGKYIGAFLGCLLAGKNKKVRNNLGLALIPQAGVAIGLAAMGARTLGGAMGDALETIMDTLMSLQMSDPIAQHLGSWSQEINVLSICLRIALAVFLTSVIGCERSSKRHSAGLRTFVLISFSSTICMILDIYLMQTQAIDIPILSAATMISAASISGKSILFSSRGQIKGLTTSAALWSCAALGFTIGAGLYTVTLIVFAFLLCILSAFPTIEVYLKNRSNHFEIHLELKNIEYLRDFVTVSRRLGLRIDDIESNPAYVGSGLSVYTITVTICSSELKKYKTHHEIIEALKSLDYIYHLEELR